MCCFRGVGGVGGVGGTPGQPRLVARAIVSTADRGSIPTFCGDPQAGGGGARGGR